MRQKRYDKITLDRARAIMLDNGMMRVPAKISRAGVQEYRRGDGKTERAYRPPVEVGSQTAVASFDAVTLVNDHPRENNSVVDAKNAKRLGVGVVMNPVYRDGFVEADLLIQDAEAVDLVKSGKVELSAGYFMDRDETPGTTPEGERYDFVQRNIRANHVAIVDQGRAGPECRIQLDAADAITTDFQIPENPERGGHTPSVGVPIMQKLVIDGVTVEVSDLAATLFQKERGLSASLLDASKAEVATLKTALEKKAAECDAANDKVKAQAAEIASLPAKLQAQASERNALEAQVKSIAPDFKCDGLDVMAIKRGVLTAAKVKMSSEAPDYVNARFEGYVEAQSVQNPAAKVVADALKGTPATETVIDLKELRAKAEAEFFNPSAKK